MGISVPVIDRTLTDPTEDVSASGLEGFVTLRSPRMEPLQRKFSVSHHHRVGDSDCLGLY